MELTVAQLKYVVAVAEELHFTRAAERLLISTPALSQQIAAAERRLGVALFRRTSRGVRLTDAGRRFLPLARRVIAAMDEVTAWGQAERRAEPVVRVGLPISWLMMSRVFATVAQRRPELRIETHRIGFGDAAAEVRSGRVDVALSVFREPPREPDLHSVPLWTESRSLVVGAGHRLAGRSSVTLAETNHERFVSFLDGDSPYLREWLVVPRPDGSTPRIDVAADTFEDALDLCAAGLAVHIVGCAAARGHDRPGVRFIPISDTFDVTAYLLRRPDTANAAALAFEDLVTEVVRDSAASYGVKPVSRGSRSRPE